ncbi:MAG: Zn-dependent oligopeptidase [Candidatus Eisenbacteria bacterium]|nr:Zn-dependent oligopeptidase [Candidatus Eisenbacteria bacterium]
MSLARTAIDKMLAVRGPRTIANTLVPYDEALRQLDMAGSQASLAENVLPDRATRNAAEKLSQDVAAYFTELSLNRKVYDALAALDLAGTDPATKYYVTRTLRDFRLAGVNKDDATRARIKQVSDEVVAVGQEFGRNIREDKSTITCTPDELAGLPADYIARHAPGPDGRITLSIEYPDAIPLFAYAKSDDVRRRMYMAYNNRAWPKNMAVLDSLRAKRHELATLLGFPNWADCITADKMVGSAANARGFIDRVVAASADRQAREYEQLLAAKRKEVPDATVVNFWEVNYYKEQVRKADYDFDSQQMRPYLPYDRVKDGILATAAKLFDVEFRRVKDAPVWSPDVECYELWDGGKLAGRFYLDMHPRADKYNHAAQFDIRTGIEGRQIPEAALVCNFPGGTPGDPGLCEISDATTFFHEFGHLLHTMFAGHGRWVGIGGIRTEQDFVEAPSQMLEEWMKSPEVLASFAKNYQTDEPVPADLVRRMNRANAFAKGIDVRRQMVYAGSSLACYDRDPNGVDTDALFSDLVRKYQPFPFVEGTHFQCAFGHLNGYSAVYYTYMWSLVIAKDMFSKFDPAHMLAPGAAKEYRMKVLAPGGSKPAAQLVADFLGRPFNENAWKEWLNRVDQ